MSQTFSCHPNSCYYCCLICSTNYSYYHLPCRSSRFSLSHNRLRCQFYLSASALLHRCSPLPSSAFRCWDASPCSKDLEFHFRFATPLRRPRVAFDSWYVRTSDDGREWDWRWDRPFWAVNIVCLGRWGLSANRSSCFSFRKWQNHWISPTS